ncbi:Histone deacetylase hda1 [Puccinia graminis f. sp. tritici]|uniref:Histone deacetylase hda1 n=1 Tax=Puccinia graminis f. sp. tritici TaxID=56615 RepID=A0A5B0LNI7_PUCGR|nr:Histone deacetylase hda1 [Puccinia graminis f. sp. tritici]
MAHEKQNGTSTSNPHHAPPSTSLSRPSRTGICHSQQMLKHWKPDVQFDTIKDQDDENEEPERPSRIARIIAHVSKQKLTDNLEHIKIRKATKEEIMLVHSEGHWKRIEETASKSCANIT